MGKLWYNGFEGGENGMTKIEFLTLFLSSTVVASIISYLSTQKTNAKSHKVKYITEERQNWRRDIKNTVALFCSTDDKSEKIKLKTFIALSLNPCDEDDKEIVNCLEKIIDGIDSDKNTKELETQVAFLLKHDWERVKGEVGIKNKEVDRKNKVCK